MDKGWKKKSDLTCRVQIPEPPWGEGKDFISNTATIKNFKHRDLPTSTTCTIDPEWHHQQLVVCRKPDIMSVKITSLVFKDLCHLTTSTFGTIELLSKFHFVVLLPVKISFLRFKVKATIYPTYLDYASIV